MTSEKTIEKSKLIKLLSSFSTLEWKRFGRFVQSPYHNSNQHVITLYTILKKVFPFDTPKHLEQERLYKKVYGKEAFKLSKFQNLCSDLYELAIDFMVDVHLSKEKRKKKKLIVDALSERNYELFKGASQQLIKEVEGQEYFLDGDDFLLLYQLNDELYHHIERDGFSVEQLEMENALSYLFAFYENATGQLVAEDIGNKNFLKKREELEKKDRRPLNEILQEVKHLHQSKDAVLYFQLKDKILASWDFLKLKYKRVLLVHLINFSFTIDLIQKEYGHKESLELYKIGIREKLFIINGKMRDIEFLNIGMIGFSLSEQDWTTHFIENHKQYLTEELRSFLIPLIYAYNANFQKKYELVIDLLRTINPSNHLLYLPKIKNLLIRAYFEGLVNGEEHYRNALKSEIDSFQKMMLRDNKTSELKKESYLNFLNLTKRLIKLMNSKPVDLRQIQAFEKRLKETTPLILKKWLFEKFVEVKHTAS